MHARGTGADGFAIVDAMVGLLIVAATVGLSLQGMLQAQRAATLLAVVSSAVRLGDRAIQGARSQGDYSQILWTVRESSLGAARPVALCDRTVELTSQSSRRVYSISTIVTCAENEPS